MSHRAVFITAAPVGAVPKYTVPSSVKFLSDTIVQDTPCLLAALTSENGWEKAVGKGLLLSHCYQKNPHIPINDTLISTTPTRQPGSEDDAHPVESNWLVLSGDILSKAGKLDASRKLVLHLTGQGWTSNGHGDLEWNHADPAESYLPPTLVATVSPTLVESLQQQGWRPTERGYFQSGRSASTFVPIHPPSIVAESLAAIRAGASIVHLHTRDKSDAKTWSLPGLGTHLTTGSQSNRILPDEYDQILPDLRCQAPDVIFNVSTSLRGNDGADCKPRSRVLRGYGPDNLPPEAFSFSPGKVHFRNGSGYDNPDDFLLRQLALSENLGLRPEVEVFNRTILARTLGRYRSHLERVDKPVLLMLIGAVDQYRKLAGGQLGDDSLIPADVAQRVRALVCTGGSAEETLAVNLVVESLAPHVLQIRSNMPSAVISLLMPGPLQILLPKVVVLLQLDGVRVGLEDSLTVADDTLPGGCRKGRTCEQVARVKHALQESGYHIMSAEETRQRLQMPSPAYRILATAISVVSSLGLDTEDMLESGPNAQHLKLALEAFSPILSKRETWFIAKLQDTMNAIDTSNGVDALASTVQHLIRKSGLFVRYFVEERDRYPAEGAKTFTSVHTIQALNTAYELLLEHGENVSVCREALQRLARDRSLAETAYLVHESQRKSQYLRLLEFLTSLSAQLSDDGDSESNTFARQIPGYSHFHAVLALEMERLYQAMRQHAESEAEMKYAGAVFLPIPAGENRPPLTWHDAGPALSGADWIVLPSTPTTNYAEGARLGRGLGKVFALHVGRMVHCSQLRLVGILHPGLLPDGRPVVEASLVHSRYALDTPSRHGTVGFPARQLYETVLLPRLVRDATRLGRDKTHGLVCRLGGGRPCYEDGSAALRIRSDDVAGLDPLRFLAHSSGVATVQQMDNAMRADATLLGFTETEQRTLFNRSVVVSFGSTAELDVELPGTPVVDVTATNDARSVAGTTTLDYTIVRPGWPRPSQAELDGDLKYRYSQGQWKLFGSTGGRIVLRRLGVVLRRDPARAHDGHSIRRYLEGAPETVHCVVKQLHEAGGRVDFGAELAKLGTANVAVDCLHETGPSWRIEAGNLST